MSTFDPSVTASYTTGLFGLPTSYEQSRLIVIPVPWEVTTSYGSGASLGPECVWKASPQVDLFDFDFGLAYEQGYHLLEIPTALRELNNQLKPKALAIRDSLERHDELDAASLDLQNEVNRGCAQMSDWVYEQSRRIIEHGKIPAVLGGDHSSPEGNIRAIAEKHPDVGLLHIDAHADLRFQYQGFQRSHASIMNNVMNASWRPAKLVQVAIRDFSQEEYQLSEQRADIQTFYDAKIKAELFEGRSWLSVCEAVCRELPEKVYVSFDIDGLSPEYCPHTGTPVPGGLSFDQANYLLRTLVRSGRKIVGFDLNEVAPGDDEWDGNVGARLLYKLCGWAILSQPHNVSLD